MAVPDVNMKFLEDLEDMGFTRARAIRALHYSGNAGIEAAINWIVDHENDTDIDEMPRESIDVNIGSPEPQFLTEAMKLKAQELRDRAQKNLERQREREIEKERIRTGKELFEAKRIAEENERRRFVASKKADKEEEKRARERILKKLQSDKQERRARLGLTSENNPRVPLNPSILPCSDDNTKNYLSVYPVSKAEQLRECLRSMRLTHKAEDSRVKRGLETLLIYIGNVAKNPGEEKLRRIRLSNPVFQERVGRLTGGVEFLELCGFEKTQGGLLLLLPQEKVDMGVLNVAGYQLKSALTNPFFGLLSPPHPIQLINVPTW